MNWLNRILWIVVSPSRTFADVREGRAQWWEPWIVQALLATLAGYVSVPAQRAVLELNVRGMTAEQLDQAIEYFDKFKWAQLAVVPPMMLLVGLALAGVTYIVVTLLSSKANFKQYFTVTLYASVIGGLSMLVSSAVVRARGVDAIRTPEDAQVTLGLGFLAPDGVAHAILGAIDVFAVWSLFLIGMGLVHVFGMTRKHAIYCIIPWFLIYLVLAAAGKLIGGAG
jgi:hypothetical protein